MAPLITHLVVGERAFARLRRFEPAAFGTFLLGCVLVDVHGFSDVDRRTTHFVGRLHEDGEGAFTRSCANFLGQLDTLLVRPWDELAEQEQAFVAGYLCHLAVDETWKRLGRDAMLALGIASLSDTPVPGEVFMTAVDVLSSGMYIDFPSIVSGLSSASVPDVMAHVPYSAFQAMWAIVKPHALDGKTAESYFEMIERLGRADVELQAMRGEHDAYWKDALTWIEDLGGVEPYIQDAARRSLEVLPCLDLKRRSFHVTIRS